jgi:hypothetical protein
VWSPAGVPGSLLPGRSLINYKVAFQCGDLPIARARPVLALTVGERVTGLLLDEGDLGTSGSEAFASRCLRIFSMTAESWMRADSHQTATSRPSLNRCQRPVSDASFTPESGP